MGFYRWLGCFLLLLVGSGVSLVLFAYERRRCRQAEGFLALVSLLRSQIDCFSIPIGGILKKCDPRILRDCGLDDGEDLTDMPSLLSACHLLLPEEECALLADFARQLGGGYREEQLRSCSYCAERLTACCDRLRAELPKREKMAIILPLSAAVLLILMLL